jgi:signal transduction histidine kinase
MSNRLIADEDRGAFRFSGLNVERDTSWGIYAAEDEEVSQGYEAVEPRFDAELNTIAKQGATRPYESREIDREILNILKLMSHDIRGPLNSVAAGLKLLKKGAYGTMAKGVSQEVDVLFAMVRELIGSAEDFLARASSFDDGPNISREPLNVKEDVVDPLLQELSREIQRRALIVEDNLNAVPCDSLLIQGDRFWMKVILRNLLTNALKYASKGGRVTIGFENLCSHIRMSVFNTGTPVPEKHRDVLFTKFGRVLSKENQNTEGMGLGLYLVRGIIQRQGGCIWYEPADDGSIFSFILPNA